LSSDNRSTEPTPSVLDKDTNRLLPQVSFRTMMLVATVTAMVAFTTRLALGGSMIAISFVNAVATLVITFVCFAILFVIAWIPAVIGYDSLEDTNLGSPFAEDQLPPQVIPPRDPT